MIHETLQIVNDVGVMIRNSAKRLSTFAQIHDSVYSAPRPLCPTRWIDRVSAISRVLESYKVVLETLSYTSDAACSARGLIMQF